MLSSARERFSYDVRPDRDRVIVALAGELCMASSPQVSEELEELAGAGFKHLVVDLGELTFIDSTGLNLLISCRRLAAERDTAVTLAAASPHVRRVFELAGLSTSFCFEAERTAA